MNSREVIELKKDKILKILDIVSDEDLYTACNILACAMVEVYDALNEKNGLEAGYGSKGQLQRKE